MADPILAQSFCTLAELDEDLNNLGSERENRVYKKIKAASDFLQKEIGWFLPVTQTRYITQRNEGSRRLKVHELLAVTGTITIDGFTLLTTDYVLQPDGRMWANGPYPVLDLPDTGGHFGYWSCLLNGNVIPGQWGLYSLTEALTAKLAADQASVSVATLQVDDASMISPGLVVLLESEQELVTATGAPTAAVTTLAADLNAVDETMTLNNGALLTIGETFRSGTEQFKLRDLNGNTAYVTRGWNRTLKAAHTNGTAVDVYRTFVVVRGVNGTTAATHSGALALARQSPPEDINALARATAGKMLKYAQGGFAGKVGDENTGAVTYNFALPSQAEIDMIAANYCIPHA